VSAWCPSFELLIRYTDFDENRFSFCAITNYPNLELQMSYKNMSRYSSVGKVTDYGLDDLGKRFFFIPQLGPGAHPDPYPKGTRGSSRNGKAAGASS
jgi:hypothetical protein